MQISLFNEKIYDAYPFMKWLGGKRQLIDILEDRLPSNIKKSKTIDKYFEPFIGGGAFFFFLMSNYKVKEAYISDINKELILVYNVIKKDYKLLTENLKSLQNEYNSSNEAKREEIYYSVRDTFNKNLSNFDYENYDERHIERAAYTIFMNRTGFNGLFRVNMNGEFNVPKGRYKNPKICDKENLKNVHEILKNVTIRNASYLKSEELIDENSFVYLDPPYRPLTKTSSFTSYSDNEFNDEHQIELANYCKRIHDKGAKFMLSNSDPHNSDENDDFFDDLYTEFTIERVLAKRNINSKGDKRGPINELLIYNY